MADRDAAIVSYVPLAEQIARSYRCPIDVDDRTSEALLAVIASVDAQGPTVTRAYVAKAIRNALHNLHRQYTRRAELGLVGKGGGLDDSTLEGIPDVR